MSAINQVKKKPAACLPGVADTTESDAKGAADEAAESDDTDAEAELMPEEMADDEETPGDAAAELEGGGVTTDEAALPGAEGVATEEAEDIT